MEQRADDEPPGRPTFPRKLEAPERSVVRIEFHAEGLNAHGVAPSNQEAQTLQAGHLSSEWASRKDDQLLWSHPQQVDPVVQETTPITKLDSSALGTDQSRVPLLFNQHNSHYGWGVRGYFRSGTNWSEVTQIPSFYRTTRSIC